MADDPPEHARATLETYPRPTPSGGAGMVVQVLVVICGWLVLCFALLFGGTFELGSDGLTRLVVTILPVAVLWVTVRALRRVSALEEENARLDASLATMRKTLLEQQQAHAVTPAGIHRATAPALPGLSEPPPSAPAETPTPNVITPDTDRPDATAPEASPDTAGRVATTDLLASAEPSQPIDHATLPNAGEPELPLGADLTESWPDAETLLRALNFPEDASDRAGFQALRSAREDKQIDELLRAAEDVLTILSQDGIYMDDLVVDLPEATLWRAFADGDRGPNLSGLGAITDQATLDRIATRKHEDPIFRDAALHFLQRFDKTLTRLAPNASDPLLHALGATRTARCFMLLARVAGSFD